MTTHFLREQAVFLPSDDHLSRRTEAAVRPARAGGWVGTARSALARVREVLHRRAVLRELNALTDRELADIGLTRPELHRVFDPAFAPAGRGA